MGERCPHCGGKLGEDQVVEWGGWSVSEHNQRGFPGNVHLTPHLTIILAALIRAHGNVVTRDALFMMIYGDRADGSWPDNDTTIDVRITHLRRKMGVRVRAVWKSGYRLEAKDG